MRANGRWVCPKTTRGASVPSSSSSSSPASSGSNERTSLTGEPWQISVPSIGSEKGSEARSATVSSPSAARAAAIAPGTTGLSGAAPGSAVQRSPLPRIQLARSSARSRSTVSAGQPPNSA